MKKKLVAVFFAFAGVIAFSQTDAQARPVFAEDRRILGIAASSWPASSSASPRRDDTSCCRSARCRAPWSSRWAHWRGQRDALALIIGRYAGAVYLVRGQRPASWLIDQRDGRFNLRHADFPRHVCVARRLSGGWLAVTCGGNGNRLD